jgi:hypothetical protein
VKNDYGTELEAMALNGLEDPLKKWNEKFHCCVQKGMQLGPIPSKI